MRRILLLTFGLPLALTACADYSLEKADGAYDEADTGSSDDTGAAGESPDDDEGDPER